jgi:pimeloyl-ACP methyl ester carboxylesterase
MRPEKLTILNHKQEKIVGKFYKNNSKTIVIICHGIDAINNIPDIEYYFEWYHSVGATVFSFDFSGFGESDGEKTLSLRKRDAEIKAVLDYFAPHYKEIILYGASYAGLSVAIAAGKYKQITKLVALNGLYTFNPARLAFSQIWRLVIHLILHPLFWNDIFYSIRELKIEKITIPTFVMYGEGDTIVSNQQSLYFYHKLSSKKTLVSVPHGDHMLLKKEYIPVTKALPEWIKQQVVYK